MTPARAAREAAGMSQEEVSKRARICVPYLRRIERGEGAPYSTATRLATLYGCRIDVFLSRKGSRDKKRTAGVSGRRKRPNSTNGKSDA